MIDRLEYLHYRKLIHRDIKPDNFVIGRGAKSHIVYILDFGLAKKYWSSTHQCHIPFKTGKKLTDDELILKINEYKDLYEFAEIVPLSALNNDLT